MSVSKNVLHDLLPTGSVFPSQSHRQFRGALLLGLGTALPPHAISQTDACAFHERVMEADGRLNGWREPSRALARRIYSRSGIETRHTVLSDHLQSDPAEFTFYPKRQSLEPLPGTAQRMAVFERESVELAESAARYALDSAGIQAEQVTHLVISTCTGFFAPGPDVLLVRRLGLRPSVSRTILGFMGCYAGISGIRTADQIVRGDPGAVVLQICVELCSLHYSKETSPDAVVAGAIFGDGAAAAVYAGTEWESGCGQQPMAQVRSTWSHFSADSLDQMSWRIGNHGFVMRLDVGVPDVLRREAPAFVEAMASAAGLTREEITNWAIHPGGRRIVEALRDGLGLTDEDVASSMSVLRECGNMSSATILFVLARELQREDRQAGPLAAMAFGPGLTVEGAMLERLE